MESNERKDEVTCTYNGRGELTLWYSAPVSFTYTFPSANTVSLVREYRKYDEEKDTFAIMSVRLTYTKD
jgi:hypothetical protein